MFLLPTPPGRSPSSAPRGRLAPAAASRAVSLEFERGSLFSSRGLSCSRGLLCHATATRKILAPSRSSECRGASLHNTPKTEEITRVDLPLAPSERDDPGGRGGLSRTPPPPHTRASPRARTLPAASRDGAGWRHSFLRNCPPKARVDCAASEYPGGPSG